MAENVHTITGIYHTEKLAQEALADLRNSGFPEERLRLLKPHDVRQETKLEPEGGAVADTVVKDILIGTGVGGGAGLAGSAAFAILNTAVFMTNPVMGTLVIAGYGAGVGGLVGAIKGIGLKETEFLGTVEQALNKGHWVVAAHTTTEEEEEKAKAVIEESVGEEVSD